MYEFMPVGLGWETVYETTWYGSETGNIKRCNVPAGEAEQRCFKSTTPEQALAIQSECERIGAPCETDEEEGSTWCCAPGRPDRQLREGEVITFESEDVIVPGRDPVPIHQQSFFDKLMHPGAMAALGLLAVVGYLGYSVFVAQESRWKNV